VFLVFSAFFNFFGFFDDMLLLMLSHPTKT